MSKYFRESLGIRDYVQKLRFPHTKGKYGSLFLCCFFSLSNTKAINQSGLLFK